MGCLFLLSQVVSIVYHFPFHLSSTLYISNLLTEGHQAVEAKEERRCVSMPKWVRPSSNVTSRELTF
jgi:hypothetical protein